MKQTECKEGKTTEIMTTVFINKTSDPDFN